MLESLEKSNMKRMSIESPEKRPDLKFDPERDVSEEQWRDIAEDYEKYLNKKEWPTVAVAQSSVTIMGMQRKLPGLSQEQKNEMLQDLYTVHNSDIKFAADIETLDPEIVVDPKRLDWEKIYDDLDADSTYVENYKRYLERLAAVRFFGRVKEEPDLNLLETLLSSTRNVSGNEGDWYAVASALAKTRLLYPEMNLNITEKEWENMRIEIGIGGGILDALVASDLTILAAKDARIEGGRIMVTMNEKKEEEKNIMPDQRNF